mmetsp:Transcript_138099/g.441214  ORF Transcript_138099/g.441214 Transcript_138099/m.441214 type:complete len:341 (+) Transcript_138099:1075-2097(+)
MRDVTVSWRTPSARRDSAALPASAAALVASSTAVLVCLPSSETDATSLRACSNCSDMEVLCLRSSSSTTCSCAWRAVRMSSNSVRTSSAVLCERVAWSPTSSHRSCMRRSSMRHVESSRASRLSALSPTCRAAPVASSAASLASRPWRPAAPTLSTVCCNCSLVERTNSSRSCLTSSAIRLAASPTEIVASRPSAAPVSRKRRSSTASSVCRRREPSSEATLASAAEARWSALRATEAVASTDCSAALKRSTTPRASEAPRSTCACRFRVATPISSVRSSKRLRRESSWLLASAAPVSAARLASCRAASRRLSTRASRARTRASKRWRPESRSATDREAA